MTNTLLGITGSAKGASIQLIDYSSKPVILGQKTTLQELAQSSNTDLEFTAYLKPNPGVAASDIVEGNFTSTVNFIMNYE
ncbi:P pilus assembly protein, pilin FimA [Yersinia intermedia ATCC 29909]|nr:P pilus assembly protein, pilin FimA [Yersinia intermedia ATCC 29909]